MSKKTAIAKRLQEAGVEEEQAEAIVWQIVENIVPQAVISPACLIPCSALERRLFFPSEQ